MLYLHSPMRLHGVVLSWGSTGTTYLTYLCNSYLEEVAHKCMDAGRTYEMQHKVQLHIYLVRLRYVTLG